MTQGGWVERDRCSRERCHHDDGTSSVASGPHDYLLAQQTSQKIQLHTCMYTYMYVHVYIRVHTCMYVHGYIIHQLHVYVYVRGCMCVCMYNVHIH